ncbi:24763_t:CDS:2 [Racocetra persica]|uniref:24763_t:CDS:1 n=1 Tax=Racocetra persica TaxID=160502 RepID=A0ACA9L0H3_9GLOM|nr:24763_t:CDS:2 [Racocetra persica]
MFETIEDNKEIIKASIKLIWIATNGKVVNITFDDSILSAKVVLDNNTSKIIILDELEAVLLNKNNYRNIRNELARKSSIAIDEEEIDDGIQANANIIESDVAKTAQQIEKQQINKCFKDQSYNAIKKNQRNENQVLDSNFQQLNTSEITIEKSVAQSSSFDIDEDNAIKGSNLSDDTGTSVSDPSNANEKSQENEVQVLKSKVQVNYNHVDDSIERISSDLTDNSLPSISEILINPPLIRNDSSSRNTTLSYSNNVEKDSDRNDVQAILSIINNQKNLLSNNNQHKPEMEIENTSSYLVPIVLVDNNSV